MSCAATASLWPLLATTHGTSSMPTVTWTCWRFSTRCPNQAILSLTLQSPTRLCISDSLVQSSAAPTPSTRVIWQFLAQPVDNASCAPAQAALQLSVGCRTCMKSATSCSPVTQYRRIACAGQWHSFAKQCDTNRMDKPMTVNIWVRADTVFT